MPGLFSRLKSRDGARSKKKNANNDLADVLPQKPKWDDAYARKTVEPEEIHELIRCCTDELKARGLDHPFLLLPFRPTSDPSAVRTFIRNFFDQHSNLKGELLGQELRMTEPMVIVGVAKWCWSRLQGGIVGWDAYELFKVGEIDSNMARDSFKTFIPISVENGARQRIIFDFFDLMAALVSHSKANGFGGRKLSRMAAWWAFERKDSDNNGFEGGYNAWLSAADATSHLFFAYLRSLSPEQSVTGISMLPTSLLKLLQETEYPPLRPELLMASTNKVVMIVDAVSPTPFALLRRANHFQYRDTDRALQEFSGFDDPIQALTEECRRVLKAISAANQSQVSSSKHSTSLRDASWSRFEDIGFASALEEEDDDDEGAAARKQPQGLRSTPASGNGLARPTTPSWADFLSSGFVDDGPVKTNMLLPPDKVLPPIDTQTRQRSSQSHRPRLESDSIVEPGELASITLFDLDEAFWWVWMSSLAPEETPERKSAFGRCAVVETKIRTGRWLVMEEIIAGAAPEPVEGAYIAEKKGFFSWTRRGKSLGRRKSTGKHALDRGDKTPTNNFATSKTSIGPDTHARIQAKAAQLRAAETNEKLALQNAQQNGRRGRTGGDAMHEKTNSVFTLQPNVANEAKSAMKWANKYDKGAIKEAYLANNNAGRGLSVSPAPLRRVPVPTATPEHTNGHSTEQPPEVPSKAPVDAAETPKSPVAAPSPISSPHPPAVTPVPEQELADQPPVRTVEEPVPQQPEPEDQVSPVPPPKDNEPADAAPPAVSSPEPVVELSPESKKQHKKLHKESKEKPAGFRKLFGRKNRASKLPENASTNLKDMLKQEEAAAVPTPETPVQQLTPAATPSPGPEESEPTMTASAEGLEPTLETPKAEHPEPSYDPTAGEDLSRVNTQDAAEANQEFARFDQGPLADQPAFVPQVEEDDATPPPIARHAGRSETSLASKHAPERPKEVLRDGASPVIQDRWAQIRKNAAERAAVRQSEEQSHGAQSKTDGDDDTSGEETIESRVARIKARVAELTGTMEGSNAPGNNAPGKSYP